MLARQLSAASSFRGNLSQGKRARAGNARPSDCRKGCVHPLAPSARELRPQAVGERTVRLPEIFRAMARFSPSAPTGHLPRRGRFFDTLGRAMPAPTNRFFAGPCSKKSRTAFTVRLNGSLIFPSSPSFCGGGRARCRLWPREHRGYSSTGSGHGQGCGRTRP